ncbi:MAG: hypothetical protein AB7F89_06690 [Pirellulaceae bacterium]
MHEIGDALRDAGVAAIYLVHGTFLGQDALGILADVSRFAPDVARVLRRWQKQLVDAVTGEIGNFAARYAAEFEQLLGGETDTRIPVRLFHWSSENHHIGRADGAVRLIEELLERQYPPGSRVLLWGHSHSGNVFALLTNLLGSDLPARRLFFEQCRCFFHCPVLRRIDLPEWRRVEEAVCGREDVFGGVGLDLVTFGTPVRYGWDPQGYRSLTHFIHHRPVAGVPVGCARFPPTVQDLIYAEGGDVVQQLGIAGTNFPPPFWEWRTWLADLRLGELLQSGCASTDVFSRWQLGQRVHADGDNLLVDYGPSSGNVALHLFGHAVYTRTEWLPFHVEEVARRIGVLKVPGVPGLAGRSVAK